MPQVPLSAEGYRRLRRGVFKEADLPEGRFEEIVEPAPAETIRLGKYRILREVARGGMGIVFEAEDPELRRLVAIKVLKADAEDPVLLKRLHREAAIAAKLAHPGIVSVHEVGTAHVRPDRSTPFIVMDFVKGTTLAEILRTTERAELLRMVEEVAQAVAYAHSRGVVHRDLKPSNILVEEGTGRVVLTDFGLARAEGIGTRITRSHAVVGTPQYMSPEQVEGRTRKIDARTDVYALGVILYEVLTGRPPFVEETPARLYSRILRDEPERPSRFGRGIEGDLEVICLKALEKDPKLRYGNAGEFAEDLKRFRAGEPIRARRVSGWRRTWRALRRKKFLAGSAVAVILVIATTFAIGGWTHKNVGAERQRRERASKQLSASWAKVVQCHRDLRAGRVEPRKGRRLLEEAIRELDEYVSEWGERPEGYYIRARGHLYLGDLERSERDVRSSLDRRPDFRPGWTLLGWIKLERAERRYLGCRSSLQDYWGARSSLLREAAENLVRGWEPGNEEEEAERWGIPWTREDRVLAILVRALRECFAENHPSEAQRILEAAFREYRAEEFSCLLGVLASDPKEKVARYSEALRLAPGYAKAYFMRGIAYDASGSHAAAMADYDRALEIREDFAEAFVNRALAKVGRKDPQGAIADCDRALGLRPDLVEAYVNRAVAKESLGDAAGAMADYGRALQWCEELPEVYNNRGILRKAQGDFEGARKDLDRAVELAPDFAVAYCNRGSLRHRRGDWDGAIADYDRALEISPDYGAAYLNRGISRKARGDLPGAAADFDRAVDLLPELLQAYLERAEVRESLGNFSGAVLDHDAVIQIDPTATVRYVRRAWAKKRCGDPSGAVADCDRALALGGEDADAFLNRGAAKVDLRDYPGAVEDFGRAIEIRREFYLAYANRGSVRHFLGDDRGAAPDLQEALRLAPPDWPNRAWAEGLLRSARRSVEER